jgi:putative tryptophan/tyrosine transport system substrate-binding protein
MRRRTFLGLLAAAPAAWTSGAQAEEPARVRKIGFLMGYPAEDPQLQAGIKAFLEGLRALGLEVGRNIQIEYRWPGIDAEKARAFARELIALKPDLIVASTNQVVSIAMQETKTIPILFVYIGDPIGSHYAATVARPGGNLTGFANFEKPIGGKWLEMLKEIAPNTRRCGFIYHPDASPNVEFLEAAQDSAASFGLQLTAIPVRDLDGIERQVTKFAVDGSDGGIVVAPHALTLGASKLIAGLALRNRLPGVYGDRHFVQVGGLMSFGIAVPDQLRRAAGYVDLIFKGARPGDLPVQLPTKYALVINLRTARELGLDVSPGLIARADEVME